MSSDHYNELQLMEALASNPETSQAALAEKLGIAVGTVNWYLKRWSTKGYVKVKRVSRWRWHYLLTPEGLSEKARLTGKYLDASLRLFRQIRQETIDLVETIKAAGFSMVELSGTPEIVEICRLTCLEQQMHFTKEPNAAIPTIQVDSITLQLIWPVETLGDTGAN